MDLIQNPERYTDADHAGTALSYKCTLICYEDVSDISDLFINVNYVGCLPLTKVFPDVDNSTLEELFLNPEFAELKRSLGLRENAINDNLRYGQLVCVSKNHITAQHVTCLIRKLFVKRYSSLLQQGYLRFLRLPNETVHPIVCEDFTAWTRISISLGFQEEEQLHSNRGPGKISFN